MVANQEYSSFVCIFGAILNYVLCACASSLFDQGQPDDAPLACEQVLLPSPTPLPLGTQRALSSLASSNTRSMGLPLPYFEIMRDGIAKKIRTQSLICDDCHQVGGIKSPRKVWPWGLFLTWLMFWQIACVQLPPPLRKNRRRGPFSDFFWGEGSGCIQAFDRLCEIHYHARLAQLGERRSAEREVASSNPGRTNTQGLKNNWGESAVFVMTSAND